MTSSSYLFVVLSCLFAYALAAEYLPDPSFENPVSPNWVAYGSGFSTSTSFRMDGTKSITASASSTSLTYGASRGISVSPASSSPIRISGWSRSTSAVSLPSDANYGIYADITYSDGTYQYGVNVPFAAGPAHTWQFQCDTIVPTKAIASISLYAMFRWHSGTVYFDKFSVAPYTLPSVVTSSANPLKILVPLYIYPNSDWDTIQASSVNVPITVIANPANGPGTALDPVYRTYINKLSASPKVPVLGYIYSSYGGRPLSDVYAAINNWKTWYPNISGIFVDETSNNLDYLPYYKNISTYIKANLGSSAQVFLNPGQSTHENYTAIADSIMFFEQNYSTFTSAPTNIPQGWPRAPCFTGYSAAWKYKSNAVIFGVSSTQYQSVVDTAISRGFGWVYVTNDVLDNPYDSLPSYWSSLVTYIKGKNV